MPLLTALIVKKKKQLHLSWTLLYLSKKRPKAILKVFQYQILTLVKGLDKHVRQILASFSKYLLEFLVKTFSKDLYLPKSLK